MNSDVERAVVTEISNSDFHTPFTCDATVDGRNCDVEYNLDSRNSDVSTDESTSISTSAIQ